MKSLYLESDFSRAHVGRRAAVAASGPIPLLTKHQSLLLVVIVGEIETHAIDGNLIDSLVREANTLVEREGNEQKIPF